MAGYCLHIVPPGEIHVVRILGWITRVRRPGLHLRWAHVEYVTKVPAYPFVLSGTAAVETADGCSGHADVLLELQVADPILYTEQRSVLRASGPALAAAAVTTELRRRAAADIHRAGADIHRAVRAVVADGFARFGLTVVDVGISFRVDSRRDRMTA